MNSIMKMKKSIKVCFSILMLIRRSDLWEIVHQTKDVVIIMNHHHEFRSNAIFPPKRLSILTITKKLTKNKQF